jgi:hypothetical protein
MVALRTWRIAASTGAFTLAALVAWAGPAASDHQEGPAPSTCRGTTAVVTWGDPGTFGQHPESLVLSQPASRQTKTATLTTPLPAGRYDIQAVTYDGYHGREDVAQPHEQLVYELLDERGAVVATTGATTDVPDRVLEATVVTELGTVEVVRPVTAVRARAFYTGNDRSPNSVEAICLGLTVVPPVSGGGVTTTTTPPTAPTTTAPTVTPVPVPVPVPVLPEPEAEVKGIVQLPEAGPAQAIVAQPTFTG